MVPTGDVAPRKSAEQLAKAARFDKIAGSGELAEPYDQGRDLDGGGLRVGPVTLLDTQELDDRETARQALGLPPDRRARTRRTRGGQHQRHESADPGSGCGVAAARHPDLRDSDRNRRINRTCATYTPSVISRSPAGSARSTWRSAPLATTRSTSSSDSAFRRCSFQTTTPRWTISRGVQVRSRRGTGSHARAGERCRRHSPAARSCWTAGKQMVANVRLVDRGNGAAAAAVHSESSRSRRPVVPEDPLLGAVAIGPPGAGLSLGTSSYRPADPAKYGLPALVHRLFPSQFHGSQPAGPRVAAGRLLAGIGTERLPVVLLSWSDRLTGRRQARTSKIVDAVIDEVAECRCWGWFPAGVPARYPDLRPST